MQNKPVTPIPAFLFFAILLTAVSCKKEKQAPGTPAIPAAEMEYFNLMDREIKANAPSFSIDVNHDGRKDLAFGTLLVGDPINQVDKLQFLIASNIQVNLPVNDSEEVPVMNNGDEILPADFNGYRWFELSSVVLVQKVISFTAPDVWEGHWKNAVHSYLPYQVAENGKRYNGWVELSTNLTGEKIILHRAAVCKEANRVIKAGK